MIDIKEVKPLVSRKDIDDLERDVIKNVKEFINRDSDDIDSSVNLYNIDIEMKLFNILSRNYRYDKILEQLDNISLQLSRLR